MKGVKILWSLTILIRCQVREKERRPVVAFPDSDKCSSFWQEVPIGEITWLVNGESSGFREQHVRSVLSQGDREIATWRQPSSRPQRLKVTDAAISGTDVTGFQAALDQNFANALNFCGTNDVLVDNTSIS